MNRCEKCGTDVNVGTAKFLGTIYVALCMRCLRRLEAWIEAQPWGLTARRVCVWYAALRSQRRPDACHLEKALRELETCAYAHMAELEKWIEEKEQSDAR